MDTTKTPFMPSSLASESSCTVAALAMQLATHAAPLVVDVRKKEAFVAAVDTLPGALRRDPLQVDFWAATLPVAAEVLVYCVHGHEVSQNTVKALRQRGIHATFLQGGIEAWRDGGNPVMAKPVGSTTRWVTRERPTIDRIACPWLVRRVVDAQAEFLYVPTSQVRATSNAQHAIAYDVNADVADTLFTHQGDQCSFDAFIRLYHLAADTALARLAAIVRGADTNRLDLAPQAAGLLAVSLGMSRTIPNDLAMLDAMMPVYDALYAWCRDAVAGVDEPHNWQPA